METGHYYQSNQQKLAAATDRDWIVALGKCKQHIKLRLRQKTLFGAHSSVNLGEDPVDYYLSLAYHKIILGEWEWKADYSLAEQMIRIVNSQMSKEVEKVRTKKPGLAVVTHVAIEEEFYAASLPAEVDESKMEDYERRIRSIEAAIKDDIELELLWEGIKEGKKRSQLAELLDKTPKQIDKLKERLIRTVKTHTT